MDVRPTPYTSIDALYERLCAFERHIPFHLRCRTALLALPSVYADAESATRDSPEVDRSNLHRTFQQFTLALNVSESILFLQRPYFVRALQEAPQDPTRSAYAKSYLAVVERCNVLVEVVAGLYEQYPTVTARHWFFWVSSGSVDQRQRPLVSRVLCFQLGRPCPKLADDSTTSSPPPSASAR